MKRPRKKMELKVKCLVRMKNNRKKNCEVWDMYENILEKVDDLGQSFYDFGEKLKEIFGEKEEGLVPAAEAASGIKDGNDIFLLILLSLQILVYYIFALLKLFLIITCMLFLPYFLLIVLIIFLLLLLVNLCLTFCCYCVYFSPRSCCQSRNLWYQL